MVLRHYLSRAKKERPGAVRVVKTKKGSGDFLLQHLFDKQIDFVLDKSKYKSAKCGRRAGKTTAVATSLFRTALEKEGGLCVYVTVTRSQAKRILWPELLRLDDHYRLGAIFNVQDLTVRLPNSSQILLVGVSKEPDLEKLRGSTFVEVIMDECGSMNKHTEYLVKDILRPTIEDYNGTISMIGTPARACVGMFYSATSVSPEWSRHEWTVADNRKFPRWAASSDDSWRSQALGFLAQVREENGWSENDPTYRREWLGEWVIDEASLVYAYDPGTNNYKNLPEDVHWRYVVGIDLGVRDDTAFVVLAYSKYKHNCYFVDDSKSKNLDITNVAERVLYLLQRYGREKTTIVMDTGGLGAQIALELRNRYKLPVIAADKKEKMAFIELMNADMRRGLIGARPGPLTKEWLALQLNEDGEEDDRFPNHCADAALYAYRWSMHYRAQSKPKEATPEDHLWEQALRRAKGNQSLEDYV